MRCGSSTASSLNFSFCSCGSTAGVTNIIDTRPPTRSITACASPLYGTCVMSSRFCAASCAIARMLVLLPLAYDSLPGFAFTCATSSASEFAGIEGDTAR